MVKNNIFIITLEKEKTTILNPLINSCERPRFYSFFVVQPTNRNDIFYHASGSQKNNNLFFVLTYKRNYRLLA